MYKNDDKGRVYQIVNFTTLGAGILVLGRGYISHIMNMHYSLRIFFSTTRLEGEDSDVDSKSNLDYLIVI